MAMGQHNGPTIAVGRFGKPHGKHGCLYVESFTEPKENLYTYQPWWVGYDGQLRAHRLQEKHGTEARPLIRMTHCHTREEAKKYTHTMIYVYRAQLPKPRADEYYHCDLVGLSVINQAGENLGIVDHVFNNGAHDALAIEQPGASTKSSTLIPFIGQVIQQVDFEKKQVHVDWQAWDT